jgi:deferrochelatase/peroxidase EfeB
VPSSDVVAATISTKHSAAMIVSAYDVKPTDGQAAGEEQLQAKLKTIKDACDAVKARTLADGKGAQVDLLLYADLNRHHQLWDGARAFGESSRTDKAEPMIDSMQGNALASLPRRER